MCPAHRGFVALNSEGSHAFAAGSEGVAYLVVIGEMPGFFYLFLSLHARSMR